MRLRRIGSVGCLVASATVFALQPEPASSMPRQEATPVLSWHNAGDSYSSGEGVSGNEGDCAQSNDAYGPKAVTLLGQQGWEPEVGAFTACTGHLVEDFLNRRPDSAKGSLSEWAVEQGLAGGRSDVLTMSFGGNDIGFSEIIKDCLPQSDWVIGGLGGCDTSEDELRARVDALLAPTERCTGGRGGERRDSSFSWECDLLIDDRGTSTPSDDRRGSIVDFYRFLVDEHLTARGHLYVVGYPALFAPTDEWSSWNVFSCAGIRQGDAQKLTRVARHLDTTLREAVEIADDDAGRITYISRYDLFRDGGHELCGRGEDWLNGISKNRGSGVQRARYETSFHPNKAGHTPVAEMIAELVAGRDWSEPSGGTGDDGTCPSFPSGRWLGTWESDTFSPSSGTVDTDVAVGGQVLSGDLRLSGSASILGGRISGTIDCEVVTFGRVDDSIEFEGTLSADGRTLSGIYRALPRGSQALDAGTFVVEAQG